MTFEVIPTFNDLDTLKDIREKSLNPLIEQHNQLATELEELKNATPEEVLLTASQHRALAFEKPVFGYSHEIAGGDPYAQHWQRTGEPGSGSAHFDPNINQTVFRLQDDESTNTSDHHLVFDLAFWRRVRKEGFKLDIAYHANGGGSYFMMGMSAATATALDAEGLGFGSTGQGGFRFVVGKNSTGIYITVSSTSTVHYLSSYDDLSFEIPIGSNDITVYRNGAVLTTLPFEAYSHNYLNDRFTIGSGSSSSTDEDLFIKYLHISPNINPSQLVLTEEDFSLNRIINCDVAEGEIILPESAPDYSLVKLRLLTQTGLELKNHLGESIDFIKSLSLGTLEILYSNGEFKVLGASDTAKPPSKFFVLPLGGQSNGVGYGETPYDINGVDNIDPRIWQLGRYALGASATGHTVTETSLAFGNRLAEIRPFADANLQIIPATSCLDQVQNMYQHQNGGTVSYGVYLAKTLLPYLPEDYGILLVPCCRGGASFVATHSGTWDADKLSADESALKWGLNEPLGLDFYERTKYATKLNPHNVLLPFIFSQGEMDEGGRAVHHNGFKSLVEGYKQKIIDDGLVAHLPDQDIGNFKFIATSSTKWQWNLNTDTHWAKSKLGNASASFDNVVAYDNYVCLSNAWRRADGSSDLIYARIDVDEHGRFTETNRERGNGVTTSTRQIHFSTNANRIEIPKILSNVLLNYTRIFPVSGKAKSPFTNIGGHTKVLFDGVKAEALDAPAKFDLSDGLLLAQDFSTATAVTDGVLADGITVDETVAGLTLVADDEFGNVLHFAGTGYLTYNLNKGNDTSFTRAITFKPNKDVWEMTGSNLLSASSTSAENDGVLWMNRGSLSWHPNYDREADVIRYAPSMLGIWNGNFEDWQHLVLSYDADTQIAYMYFNGVPVGSLHCPSGAANNVLRLGTYASLTTVCFKGDIANTRIYDRALNPGEIGYLALVDWQQKLPQPTAVATIPEQEEEDEEHQLSDTLHELETLKLSISD